MENIVRAPSLPGSPRRWSAPTAPTTSDVVRYAARTVCTSRYGIDGLKMIASQSSGTNCPAALTAWPAGVCIQLFADRIQNAERSACCDGQSRREVQPASDALQAEEHDAQKSGLEKKAVSTSYAINGPTTGPARSEKTDQLVPNW